MRTMLSTFVVVLAVAGALSGADGIAGVATAQEHVAFSGTAPGPGEASFLATIDDATLPELLVLLRDAGCEPASLAVLSVAAQTWASYVTDAPAFVNAGFPEALDSGMPFFVRCSRWTPATAAILRVLPVPEGLTLVRTPAERPADFSGRGGASYSFQTRTVYFSFGAPFGGEQASLTHELCHAHQHWSALEAGLVFGDWLITPEGEAFMVASAARADDGALPDPIAIDPWGSAPSEDFAQVCSLWFNPAIYGTYFLDRWPALREFAERWLPPPP